MSSFIKRITAPSTNDANYYSSKNLMVKYGYGLPNCTTYVHGRWLELIGTDEKLSLNDANSYYTKNDGYTRSQTPKLGAIACWNGGQYGHVAIVEEIYQDGTMLLSESDYITKTIFRTEKVSQKGDRFGSYKLQGYILTPVNFDESRPQDDIDKLQDYTIQPGDTLLNIALDYNTTVDDLVIINNISDPNYIQAGKTIKVPVDKNKPADEYMYRISQLVVYRTFYLSNNDDVSKHINCEQRYGTWQQRYIKEIVGGRNPYKLDNGTYVNDGDIVEVK